jgi:hypothetical protein
MALQSCVVNPVCLYQRTLAIFITLLPKALRKRGDKTGAVSFN